MCIGLGRAIDDRFWRHLPDAFLIPKALIESTRWKGLMRRCSSFIGMSLACAFPNLAIQCIYLFRSQFSTSRLIWISSSDVTRAQEIYFLGAGQAFKYTPVFGEIIAALARDEEPAFDLKPFSIERFLGRPLDECCLKLEAETF
jgi:hypothetical protein